MGWMLRNDRLSLRFLDDGSLAGFYHAGLGREIWEGPPASPWRLILRDAEELECPLDAQGQTAVVSGTDTSIEVDYPGLQWRGQRLPIRLTFRVELQGEDSLWTLDLAHDGGPQISEVWFPLVARVGRLSSSGSEDALLWPSGCGRRIREPLRQLARPSGWQGYNDEARRLRLLYPGQAAMQWYALTTRDGGLYFAAEDTSLTSTCLNVVGSPAPAPSLACSLVKYPFLGQGGRWSSPPCRVAAYRGPWQAAAARYRDWARNWWRPPVPPAWVATMPGWVLIIMKQQTGTVRWRYADLPQLLAEARLGGLDTLFIFGWFRGGHDHRYPEYEPDPAMGGESALVAALQQVHDAGGHTILYTQGRLLDPTTPYYASVGRKIAARTSWGGEYKEFYSYWGAGTLHDAITGNRLDFSVACPANPEWREQLCRQAESVARLGPQGVLFDQEGGALHYLCYAQDHPHRSPAEAWGRPRVANFIAVRALLKEHDPDLAVVSENVSDVMAPLFDILHGGGAGFQPGGDGWPALFRTVFPETILTNRIIGTEDTGAAGFAFLHGFRFDVEIEGAAASFGSSPGLASFLSRLSGLRRRRPDLLLNGRYLAPAPSGFVGISPGGRCDMVHLTVRSEAVESVAFRSGRDGDEVAVCLWNPGANEEAAAVECGPGHELTRIEVVAPDAGGDRALTSKGVAGNVRVPGGAVAVALCRRTS